MKLVHVCLASIFLGLTLGSSSQDDPYKQRRRMERPKRRDDGEWKKKDVLDYDEGDIEKLGEQWDEDEEELPIDELPPWELEPPPIDMRKIDVKNKETLISEGKRHRTLMMFATVAGPVDRKRTEEISAIWEQGLFNANIQVKRYVIEDDRVLFQMDDGSQSLKIRDWLVEQESCLDVTIEQKTYDGKGKKVQDKYKPLTKEEMKKVKAEEAKKKAEREAIKLENKKRREEKEKQKQKKDKKKPKKDEL